MSDPTLRAALLEYTEPCGLVGLTPRPPNKSTTNGLVFTVTAYALAIAREDAPLAAELAARLIWLIPKHRIDLGEYGRWPREMDPFSGPAHWDDHCAVACFAAFLRRPADAKDILWHGLWHDWIWGYEDFGLILDFPPFVRACAGSKLSRISLARAAIGFLWNLTEAEEETSGKCLLWLKARAYESVYGDAMPGLLKFAIWAWRRRILRVYGGMRGVWAIYFHDYHPFTRYAPEGLV